MYELKIKFLAACERVEKHESFEAATERIRQITNDCACFRTAIKHGVEEKLLVQSFSAAHGAYIVQVFAPQEKGFKTQANLLVIFRVEEKKGE